MKAKEKREIKQQIKDPLFCGDCPNDPKWG